MFSQLLVSTKEMNKRSDNIYEIFKFDTDDFFL